MAVLDVFHKYGKEIEDRLRLRSYPLAVKLLESEEDIPEGTMRPKRDLSHRLALCQSFSKSRRLGESIAMLKEDMWCHYPVMSLGLAEVPEYFLEGYSCYPGIKTPEACRAWSQALPRLEVGKYLGVVSAPLITASFEPDLVLLYCNSAQLTVMLLGTSYKDGRDVVCRLAGDSACVYSIVPVIHNGEYHVALPCPGDRSYALARDDELIFSVPKSKLEDLLSGLRQIKVDELGYGFRWLTEPIMTLEYEKPDTYIKTAQMLGM